MVEFNCIKHPDLYICLACSIRFKTTLQIAQVWKLVKKNNEKWHL